jgi:predicted RNase H-like HicB family nuclease
MKFDIILEKAEEGGYDVVVPALDGCFAHGGTIEEAVENARKAIVCYFEALQKVNRVKLGLREFKEKTIVKEVEVTL